MKKVLMTERKKFALLVTMTVMDCVQSRDKITGIMPGIGVKIAVVEIFVELGLTLRSKAKGNLRMINQVISMND